MIENLLNESGDFITVNNFLKNDKLQFVLYTQINNAQKIDIEKLDIEYSVS